ncbi:hypothetical protein EIP86_006369 [Pleurotus ostreatoroseus]|nr:hypothetical protein EIP86_006369 [Pleurotus ostreatoroseus]
MVVLIDPRHASRTSLAASQGPSGLQTGVLHHTQLGDRQDAHIEPRDDLASENDPDDMPVHARMTLAIEEPFHVRSNMTPGFMQPSKLSIETSASPKPCIVPGNALQLIDDDPISASRSHTPSSITVVDEDGVVLHDHEHNGVIGTATEDGTVEEGDEGQGRRPMPRVRFRSRVRIASGLRRGRHHTDPTSTPSSSTSGSPSSSISAPLRWQADENAAWGPIGRRLSSFAQANGWPRRAPSVMRAKYGQAQGQVVAVNASKGKVGEREPLLGSVQHVAYVDSGLDGAWLVDEGRVGMVRRDSDETDDEERALLAAAEEAEFGRWPWRIFNRHWWWRSTEPILCCFCPDESDEGE